MSELTYTGALPSPAVFRQALAKAMVAANPIYDLFLKTKRALESTLMRVAVQPEFSEAPA